MVFIILKLYLESYAKKIFIYHFFELQYTHHHYIISVDKRDEDRTYTTTILLISAFLLTRFSSTTNFKLYYLMS